jgi:hypothetical protein
MEILVALTLLVFVAYTFSAQAQRRRITLLGAYLSKYQIENLMESLTEGYLRALGEDDPERRTQVWSVLATAETVLSEQFNRFVLDFAAVNAADARVSQLAFAFPYADKLFPRATFDMRKALSLHAHAIGNAVANRLGQSQKDKAYTLCAELFLMQHTCHWFCRSKVVASARLLARHKTSYAQVLAAVAPQTREAYVALIG